VLTGIAAIEPLLETTPSWFEIITAAAFRYFAEAPVDVAVVEVGLLGRHDATNVVDAAVAVVTSIQGDHTDFEPGWELAIAGEKAGIIAPESVAVVGDMNSDLVAVFEAEGPRRLVKLGVDFGPGEDRVAIGGHLVDLAGLEGRYDEVFLPVHGSHQVVNASIAVAAVEAFFDRELDLDVVNEAFASITLPGRFEVLGHGPLVVLDGAHNAEALVATARTLDDEFTPVGTRILVLGALDGRSIERAVGAAAEFRPDLTVCVTLAGQRGVSAGRLAAECDRRGMAREIVSSPGEGVRRALMMAAEEDVIVVTGSFRIVEPARSAVANFLSGN
ncbi:MAG TPA: cyanophycin synthetase, partial [Microthrixaceae bacterium]|nr:cyanophycin synthetase [Microthrixaceae bacterium]